MMNVPLVHTNAHTSVKILMVHTFVNVLMIWSWPTINILAFRPTIVQQKMAVALIFVTLSTKKWFVPALMVLNLTRMVTHADRRTFVQRIMADVNKYVMPN